MRFLSSPRFLTSVFALFLLTFPCFSVQAAEVYYLGQPASPEAEKTDEKKDLSFKKRLKDLVDFKSYGQYKSDRTGQISGSVLQEIYHNQTTGNINNSFLKRGAFYLTEINVNAWEQMWADYKLETRVMVRKTDDPNIEKMRDLRLKNLNVRLYNYKNMLEFGDIYADFTNFTLGSTLEGFRGEYVPWRDTKVQFVASRSEEMSSVDGQSRTRTFGAKIDQNMLMDTFLFSLVRLGSQVVTTQEDGSAAWQTGVAGEQFKNLADTVFSLDGNVEFKKYFNFLWEVARSAYRTKEQKNTDLSIRRSQYGTGLRLEPSFTSRYLGFRYLFYYVQPSFYTEVGSASADKNQHQFTVDLTPWDSVRLSFVENWYWNHLAGSMQTYRTSNDEKYITLYMRPWQSRRDFDIRTYVNYLSQNSDDFPTNLIENTTTTTGLSVNDRIWETSLGARYEYRRYQDDFDKSRSDYFNRLGTNMSRDFQLFKRRLFFSSDVTFDFHDPKSEDDNEIMTGAALNLQYDIFDRLTLRGGFNLQNSSAAAPVTGYFNTRAFGETDVLLGKQRGTHFITRIENNSYNNQDNSQDYGELRVITRFVSQF